MAEAKGDTQHQRQEQEANRFAIDLLAPTHLVAPFLERPPDIREALQMRKRLVISLEAAIRCMIDRSEKTLAAVWSQDHKVRYVVRARAFPRLKPWGGCQLPAGTAASQAITQGAACVTQMMGSHAAAWVERPDIELFEQTRIGRDKHAVTLLWANLHDSDEDKNNDYGAEA